jgi:hypothetical protein
MYLMIPTPLLFLFLAVSSFAPIASSWAGWWTAYYGALMACWIAIVVAAMRREQRKLKFLAALRQDSDAGSEMEMAADPVSEGIAYPVASLSAGGVRERERTASTGAAAPPVRASAPPSV